MKSGNDPHPFGGGPDGGGLPGQMPLAATMDVQAARRRLLAWFHENRRDLPWRRTEEPYHIWVSEVMLQQTQVTTVIPYYRRFLDRFPDIFRLAGADVQDVLKAWEGMGYYARARNFHKAAGVVAAQYGGRVPDDPGIFRSLPGVGDYIAAAVLSIAFDRPLPVVDGNVKRVLSRFMKIGAPVNKTSSYETFRGLAGAMLDHGDPGTFNQAVMELGALVCRPKNPDCRACPLSGACRAHQDRAVTSFPVREIKPPVPERRQAVGVVFRQGRVLIVRRPENGLLGGLWEFPGGDVADGESPEAACIRAMCEQAGIDVTVESLLTQIRHTYTHFRLKAHVFVCKILSRSENFGSPVISDNPDFKEDSYNLIDSGSALKQAKSISREGTMVAEAPSGFDNPETMQGRAVWVDLHELDRYPFHRAAAGVKSLILNYKP